MKKTFLSRSLVLLLLLLLGQGVVYGGTTGAKNVGRSTATGSSPGIDEESLNSGVSTVARQAEPPVIPGQKPGRGIGASGKKSASGPVRRSTRKTTKPARLGADEPSISVHHRKLSPDSLARESVALTRDKSGQDGGESNPVIAERMLTKEKDEQMVEEFEKQLPYEKRYLLPEVWIGEENDEVEDEVSGEEERNTEYQNLLAAFHKKNYPNTRRFNSKERSQKPQQVVESDPSEQDKEQLTLKAGTAKPRFYKRLLNALFSRNRKTGDAKLPERREQEESPSAEPVLEELGKEKGLSSPADKAEGLSDVDGANQLSVDDRKDLLPEVISMEKIKYQYKYPSLLNRAWYLGLGLISYAIDYSKRAVQSLYVDGKRVASQKYYPLDNSRRRFVSDAIPVDSGGQKYFVFIEKSIDHEVMGYQHFKADGTVMKSMGVNVYFVPERRGRKPYIHRNNDLLLGMEINFDEFWRAIENNPDGLVKFSVRDMQSNSSGESASEFVPMPFSTPEKSEIERVVQGHRSLKVQSSSDDQGVLVKKVYLLRPDPITSDTQHNGLYFVLNEVDLVEKVVKPTLGLEPGEVLGKLQEENGLMWNTTAFKWLSVQGGKAKADSSSKDARMDVKAWL
ncbi:hypothetical protein M3P05_03150 [Sansalvadorimonas sp. 2012CJ34-2]|uniref:Uncharacterized protein n=1 Tax=Parendozoicomonas callyspongiae TaxID=2942213 RepID=A0ABT0PEH9_9GAMM|nr:hypothetical protein [Sansalvadorimonas sp. 2012CJ34-2]MCL6268948.1 hypothetical protein [Sansalvadorimonas sp. 2012CJ34-2]